VSAKRDDSSSRGKKRKNKTKQKTKKKMTTKLVSQRATLRRLRTTADISKARWEMLGNAAYADTVEHDTRVFASGKVGIRVPYTHRFRASSAFGESK